MNCNRVDLRKGVVVLTDGQRVPVTNYLGPPDEAPDDDTEVLSFDWVKTVVAGPDADGQWLTVLVTDEDREDARDNAMTEKLDEKGRTKTQAQIEDIAREYQRYCEREDIKERVAAMKIGPSHSIENLMRDAKPQKDNAMIDRAAIIEKLEAQLEITARAKNYQKDRAVIARKAQRSIAHGLDIAKARIAELERALAAVPPHPIDRAAIIEVLKREEDYLIRMCGSEADIMPGDIEGAFHRLTEALAAVPPAPPSKQFTPQQAANLKAAFAEEGIPWPNIKINARGAHLSELLQQCVDAFEEDGGDLDHAYRLLGYTREILQWRLRGADGERPAPPSIPDRDKLLEALRIGLEGADYLRHEYGGNERDLGCQKIETAIAALEGK